MNAVVASSASELRGDSRQRPDTGAPCPFTIRPVQAPDLPLLQDFLDSLSSSTRFHRFFTARRPTVQDIGTLFPREPLQSGALLASDPASASGEVIALGQWVFDEAECADMGLVVSDQWQGRGVGAALTECLIRQIRCAGASRVMAVALSENVRVLRLARKFGFRTRPVTGMAIYTGLSLSCSGAREPDVSQVDLDARSSSAA